MREDKEEEKWHASIVQPAVFHNKSHAEMLRFHKNSQVKCDHLIQGE